MATSRIENNIRGIIVGSKVTNRQISIKQLLAALYPGHTGHAFVTSDLVSIHKSIRSRQINPLAERTFLFVGYFQASCSQSIIQNQSSLPKPGQFANNAIFFMNLSTDFSIPIGVHAAREMQSDSHLDGDAVNDERMIIASNLVRSLLLRLGIPLVRTLPYLASLPTALAPHLSPEVIQRRRGLASFQPRVPCHPLGPVLWVTLRRVVRIPVVGSKERCIVQRPVLMTRAVLGSLGGC